jgi:molecular chaperone GrpE
MADKRKPTNGSPDNPNEDDVQSESWPEDEPDEDEPEDELGDPAESETIQSDADHIHALMAEAADLKERLLRAMADMENLRKRTEREKAEARLYAATNFARDLLSVADSMDRALQSVPEEGRDQLDEATRNLLAGIEVTHKELINVLSRHGIARIEPLGGKFDPHFQQAMFEVPDGSVPAGTVVQVMQAGYTIGERCLRPALVGVAKAPPAEGSPATNGSGNGGGDTRDSGTDS